LKRIIKIKAGADVAGDIAMIQGQSKQKNYKSGLLGNNGH
tara:strand:- start:106 stop:225 length:120 start_codon:yes stop_codon:yes gene_type:complete